MIGADFVRLHLVIGTKDISILALGFEWPPPEYIHLLSDEETSYRALEHSFEGLDETEFRNLDIEEQLSCLKRQSYSQITDEQIEDMDHVIRGADYRYVVA